LEVDGKEVGEPLVMIDTLGAGIGTPVIVSSDGDLARKLTNDNSTPSRMVVVGIVDKIGIRNERQGARE
jgi:ethanolamine utilization protein EutN